MAVYTDVAAEDLAEFLTHYEIGELLSYKGIAEGVENSNFLLHTSRGAFILTLYEKRVAVDDLPYFLSLMAHLAERGVRCPQPARNRNGEVYSTLAGRPAAIINFLEGVWPRRPNAAHCAGVGHALASMHLAGRDFPLFRENPLSVRGWRPLFDLAAPRADGVQAGLHDFIARELDHLEGMLARRAAGWRHPCRPVSRQRLLPRRQIVGTDRLSVFLQRHPRLRRRDLPERLVLRDRIIPSTSPRRVRCSTPMAASANCPRPSRTRCRCWRGARRCASC